VVLDQALKYCDIRLPGKHALQVLGSGCWSEKNGSDAGEESRRKSEDHFESQRMENKQKSPFVERSYARRQQKKERGKNDESPW
jgi:hypothetical protein